MTSNEIKKRENSIKMMLNILAESPIPIYEQLVNGIETMIQKGELNEGDSLPSIRLLSSELNVAANTVAKAYKELGRIGYVKSYYAKGTFVSVRIKEGSVTLSELSTIVSKLLKCGLSRKQIHQLIDEQIDNSR